MLEEGTKAPDFEAQTDDGQTVRLADLRGKPVVLYFYPKDDTPGCTAQACGIRDAYAEFRDRGAEIFGVSRDDADSHRAFKEKYGLPFPLIIDTQRSLGDAFGIADFDMLPNSYVRSTVVIDANGNVAKAMENVDPATHAEDVLAAL
jgi:thioredoxin-dependent peroxiredoxin